MNNNVFISYAREDYLFAEQVYTFLEQNDFSPWMDKQKLMVGQDWDHEIQTALRKSDFIIILLSTASVQKRGYFQREFKAALDFCKEKLDSDIFIIPLKIDNCEVPVSLSKYHWAEFTDNPFQKILLALTFQRQSLSKANDVKKKHFNSTTTNKEDLLSNNVSSGSNEIQIERKQSKLLTAIIHLFMSVCVFISLWLFAPKLEQNVKHVLLTPTSWSDLYYDATAQLSGTDEYILSKVKTFGVFKFFKGLEFAFFLGLIWVLFGSIPLILTVIFCFIEKVTKYASGDYVEAAFYIFLFIPFILLSLWFFVCCISYLLLFLQII